MYAAQLNIVVILLITLVYSQQEDADIGSSTVYCYDPISCKLICDSGAECEGGTYYCINTAYCWIDCVYSGSKHCYQLTINVISTTVATNTNIDIGGSGSNAGNGITVNINSTYPGSTVDFSCNDVSCDDLKFACNAENGTCSVDCNGADSPKCDGGTLDCSGSNADCTATGTQNTFDIKTNSPTPAPTSQPTHVPTNNPSESPTLSGTNSPTLFTISPTINPSISPTKYPSKSPTNYPSDSPSKYPTIYPSNSPSKYPTKYPTTSPTTPTPTNNPSVTPTSIPTSYSPTDYTISPTTQYPTTINPTISPINDPSISPTLFPTIPPTRRPLPNTPSYAPTRSKSGQAGEETTENGSNKDDLKIIGDTNVMQPWIYIVIACVLIFCLCTVIVLLWRHRQKKIRKSEEAFRSVANNIHKVASVPDSPTTHDGNITNADGDGTGFETGLKDNVLADDMIMDNIISHMSTPMGSNDNLKDGQQQTMPDKAMNILFSDEGDNDDIDKINNNYVDDNEVINMVNETPMGGNDNDETPTSNVELEEIQKHIDDDDVITAGAINAQNDEEIIGDNTNGNNDEGDTDVDIDDDIINGLNNEHVTMGGNNDEYGNENDNDDFDESDDDVLDMVDTIM